MASNWFVFLVALLSTFISIISVQLYSKPWIQYFSSRRVVGGNPVKQGKIPYVVGMLRKEDGEVVCGGAVYDARHVITAAHCFDQRDPISSFRVLGGVVNRLLRHPRRLEMDIIREYKHGLFNGSENYDISILRVNGRFPPNMFVPLNSRPSVKENEKCQLAGWGSTIPHNDYEEWMGVIKPDVFPSVLNVVTFPLLSPDTCYSLYWHLRFGSELFCAGNLQGGQDGCVGDSGSPLVCGGQFVGIMSAGAGCAAAMRPGVYINITHFLPWIDYTIKRSYLEEQIERRTISTAGKWQIPTRLGKWFQAPYLTNPHEDEKIPWYSNTNPLHKNRYSMWSSSSPFWRPITRNGRSSKRRRSKSSYLRT